MSYLGTVAVNSRDENCKFQMYAIWLDFEIVYIRVYVLFYRLNCISSPRMKKLSVNDW